MLNLEKRDCGIEMKLVPYGGGWTDVHLNIGNDRLYFIITSSWGDQFSKLLDILYHLSPNQFDPHETGSVECWEGLCEKTKDGYQVVSVAEHFDQCGKVYQLVPYKAEMCWDEEGSCSCWTFTRQPTTDTNFILTIDISIRRNDTKHYSYEIPYKDFCYAVAKACTQTLKSHGFWGYHFSTYIEDINIRQLLFLKSVALENFEARELTDNGNGLGDSSSFEKEIELLLFDM